MESIQEETTTPEPKKELSESRLEALRKAREKANAVRSAAAAEKKKEKEIEKHLLAQRKKEHSERVQREYEALHKEEIRQEEPKQEEPEEEVVVQKQKKKRRIVVVQDSSSDDEVEVKLPKKKNQEPSFDDMQYRIAYNKMFEYY